MLYVKDYIRQYYYCYYMDLLFYIWFLIRERQIGIRDVKSYIYLQSEINFL